METCTAIQSRRKTQLIREYSRGAIDCSQYENFADDLNFIGFWSSTLNDFWGMASGDEWNTDKCEGLKTCTEIQSRRYDNLLTENNRFPELVTLLIKHGFDPITFDEVYCVDSFDSCL